MSHEETTETFELCFTPAPGDDAPETGPTAHIYRYAIGRRSRTEGPLTGDVPTLDRPAAEAFALEHGFVCAGDWRETDDGHDAVVLARVG